MGVEMKIITAGNANRQFSSLLREVAQGEVITVVSRGKAVATISPAVKSEQQSSAKDALLERLRAQPASGIRHWTRDELYPD